MNEKIKQLQNTAGIQVVRTLMRGDENTEVKLMLTQTQLEKFAELIVGECINKIETHQIPVGNSAAGEMACEWTYAALKEIGDEIKEHFGVE